MTYGFLSIGDTYKTTQSGYVGIITDIIPRNGRVVIELDSGARYSTL
jgi:hypothetical protein